MALREAVASPRVARFFQFAVQLHDVLNTEEYSTARRLAREYPDESVASLRRRAEAILEPNGESAVPDDSFASQPSIRTEFERRFLILAVALMAILCLPVTEEAAAAAMFSVFAYLFPISPVSRDS